MSRSCYSLKIKVPFVLLRLDVLVWFSLVATGTCHSRSPLFITSWFSKTCISISYRQMVHETSGIGPQLSLQHLLYLENIGFIVHSSFENRDWIARAEVAYAPMHLYTSVSHHVKPFLYHSLSYTTWWRWAEMRKKGMS